MLRGVVNSILGITCVISLHIGDMWLYLVIAYYLSENLAYLSLVF